MIVHISSDAVDDLTEGYWFYDIATVVAVLDARRSPQWVRDRLS